MRKLMKFRNRKVPVVVKEDGEVTVSAMVSELEHKFFITEQAYLDVFNNLENMYIDTLEQDQSEHFPKRRAWKTVIWRFPNNTLPKIVGRMKQVEKYLEEHLGNFQMI